MYTGVDTFTLTGHIFKIMLQFKFIYASGRYCTLGVAMWCILLTTLSKLPAQEKITLRESYRVGDLYKVETATEQTGVLDTIPDTQQLNLPKRLAKTGKAKSQYVEKVLSLDSERLASKTIRRYSLLEAEQTIGSDVTQARLRRSIQHIVLDRGSQAVTFSPDGPLLLGELEQARTDIYLPRLAGLLPNSTVSQGDSWKVSNPAILELTDLQQIQTGSLECTLTKVDDGQAIIRFSGQVSGTTPMGSNQQTIQGHHRFDIKLQKIISIQFEVTSLLRDKQQKQVGDVTAKFQLNRQFAGQQEIKTQRLKLEPDEDNTLLLVQEPRLGLELVHSRRWVPRPVNDKSWIIDGPSGSGITIQFEPAQNIPAGEGVRKQIESTLMRAVDGLKPMPDPPSFGDTVRYSWSGSQNGKEFVFEYYLWKQGSRGAIIAGRYFAPEAGLAIKDAERMIKSLKLAQ